MIVRGILRGGRANVNADLPCDSMAAALPFPATAQITILCGDNLEEPMRRLCLIALLALLLAPFAAPRRRRPKPGRPGR